tara:strand:+ start:242 stop:463 length:222 start_codon:yes stop_codon:yes gene_type:complete
MMIADTPYKIDLYRLLALRAALRLEVVGLLRSRGKSAYSIVKQELGVKGNKQKVLDQVNQIIQSIKEQQKGEA